jgi:hypothetical protein
VLTGDPHPDSPRLPSEKWDLDGKFFAADDEFTFNQFSTHFNASEDDDLVNVMSGGMYE